jgi:hypothetical protein
MYVFRSGETLYTRTRDLMAAFLEEGSSLGCWRAFTIRISFYWTLWFCSRMVPCPILGFEGRSHGTNWQPSSRSWFIVQATGRTYRRDRQCSRIFALIDPGSGRADDSGFGRDARSESRCWVQGRYGESSGGAVAFRFLGDESGNPSLSVMSSRWSESFSDNDGT